MPTRGSDGGEHIDCVIHEVGDVMCDKGFRFALSGVCKYHVAYGNAVFLHQPASAQQSIQVPHYGMGHVVDDAHIFCPAHCHALVEPLARGRDLLGYSLHSPNNIAHVLSLFAKRARRL
ncbi:MAG: hypothetical protein ACKPKO_20725, partial [Candidatus Fonsibacter sp.]